MVSACGVSCFVHMPALKTSEHVQVDAEKCDYLHNLMSSLSFGPSG